MQLSEKRENTVFSNLLVFAIPVFLVAMLMSAVYLRQLSGLRSILGSLYLVVLPGYVLTTAIFPEKDDLGYIGRVGLSFGLSIAVVALIGLLLNYSPWGIRLESVLVSVTVFILLCYAVACYRWVRTPVEDRFVFCLGFDMSRWQRMERLDRLMSVILTLSIVAALGAFVYAIAKPKIGERFTEFYITGPDGIAEGYSQEVVAGESIALVIGIVNHEYRDVQYRVERGEDVGVEHIASPYLGHEETWEQPHAFTLTAYSDEIVHEFRACRPPVGAKRR
jgi:uncharacterized membrane protein